MDIVSGMLSSQTSLLISANSKNKIQNFILLFYLLFVVRKSFPKHYSALVLTHFNDSLSMSSGLNMKELTTTAL